ncbi:unnamed protein product [marine sediment metagenome]|uniref:Uncharacterized protein n=1 Tax=marine sediment metagenome TaxID=412755 RepID=X1KIL5_9ZZZZ
MVTAPGGRGRAAAAGGDGALAGSGEAGATCAAPLLLPPRTRPSREPKRIMGEGRLGGALAAPASAVIFDVSTVVSSSPNKS